MPGSISSRLAAARQRTAPSRRGLDRAQAVETIDTSARWQRVFQSHGVKGPALDRCHREPAAAVSPWRAPGRQSQDDQKRDTHQRERDCESAYTRRPFTPMGKPPHKSGVYGQPASRDGETTDRENEGGRVAIVNPLNKDGKTNANAEQYPTDTSEQPGSRELLEVIHRGRRRSPPDRFGLTVGRAHSIDEHESPTSIMRVSDLHDLGVRAWRGYLELAPGGLQRRPWEPADFTRIRVDGNCLAGSQHHRYVYIPAVPLD